MHLVSFDVKWHEYCHQHGEPIAVNDSFYSMLFVKQSWIVRESHVAMVPLFMRTNSILLHSESTQIDCWVNEFRPLSWEGQDPIKSIYDYLRILLQILRLECNKWDGKRKMGK